MAQRILFNAVLFDSAVYVASNDFEDLEDYARDVVKTCNEDEYHLDAARSHFCEKIRAGIEPAEKAIRLWAGQP